MLVIVRVHLKLSVKATLPPVSLTLATTRSARCTLTVSAQLLLPSLLSATKLEGSARQTPGAAGLTRSPVVVGVTGRLTWRLLPTVMVMGVPTARQVMTMALVLQSSAARFSTPVVSTTKGP
ncbi:MAG: hypothetical protein R2851_00995 [Caldilineaceae bacterium]